jgi:hypothetical protein
MDGKQAFRRSEEESRFLANRPGYLPVGEVVDEYKAVGLQ